LDRVPDGYRQELKSGLDVLLEGLRDMMNGVSDKVTIERRKREAGEMDVDDKLEKIVDEIKGIKEINEDVIKETIKDKMRTSEREMEEKVKTALCGLKLQDFDFREVTEDRTKMIRTVTRGLREDVHPEDRDWFQRIMNRTRIQILGRKTEQRKLRNGSIHTVPILLECQDRRDASDLDGILKRGGYFCGFHWPKEVVEFMTGIRSEVRKQGYREEDHYVKVRPEERGGEVRIRAEVKAKNGGRWQMVAVWQCPPLNRNMWESVKGLYKPVVVGKVNN
jgi:hypothetical protein